MLVKLFFKLFFLYIILLNINIFTNGATINGTFNSAQGLRGFGDKLVAGDDDAGHNEDDVRKLFGINQGSDSNGIRETSNTGSNNNPPRPQDGGFDNRPSRNEIPFNGNNFGDNRRPFDRDRNQFERDRRPSNGNFDGGSVGITLEGNSQGCFINCIDHCLGFTSLQGRQSSNNGCFARCVRAECFGLGRKANRNRRNFFG